MIKERFLGNRIELMEKSTFSELEIDLNTMSFNSPGAMEFNREVPALMK